MSSQYILINNNDKSDATYNLDHKPSNGVLLDPVHGALLLSNPNNNNLVTNVS